MKLGFVIKLMSCTSICLLSFFSCFSQVSSFDDLKYIELRHDPLKTAGGSPGLDFQVAYKARNLSLSPQLGSRIILGSLIGGRSMGFDFQSMNGIILEPGIRLYMGNNRQKSTWYTSLSYQYKYEQYNNVKGKIRWNGGTQRIQYQKKIMTSGFKFAVGCKFFQLDRPWSHEFEFGFGSKEIYVTDEIPKGATLVEDIDLLHTLLVLFSHSYRFGEVMKALFMGQGKPILSLSYRICFRWDQK